MSILGHIYIALAAASLWIWTNHWEAAAFIICICFFIAKLVEDFSE